MKIILLIKCKKYNRLKPSQLNFEGISNHLIMEITSKELELFQNEHIKRLYKMFNDILGTKYELYVEGFEFCCYPENTVKSVDLLENNYTLVLSPRNQRDYCKCRIKNLNIKEVLEYLNLIIMRQGKTLWKAYYENGGKKTCEL